MPYHSTRDLHSGQQELASAHHIHLTTILKFWESMANGCAQIQMMKKGLGEELWRKKEKVALAWLEETLPTLKMPLTSDAWLEYGNK